MADGLRELLQRARLEVGLSIPDVWFLYRSAGGTLKQSAIKSYLYGWTLPQVDQYEILAEVINRALREQQKPPLLPRLAQMSYSSGIAA